MSTEPAHEHAVREATTMGLYLAIVLLAVLIGFGGDGTRDDELTVLWGTAIGLGIAHLFAVRLTAMFAAGGKPTAEDGWAALGIAVAVVVVTTIATIPYLINPETLAASTASSVLLLGVIGVTAFGSARRAEADRRASWAFTLLTVGIAVIVVAVKYALAH